MSIDRVDAAGLTDADRNGAHFERYHFETGKPEGKCWDCAEPWPCQAAYDEALAEVVRLRTARDEAEAKALNDAADALEGSKGVCGYPQNPYEFRAWLRDRAALAVTSPPSEGSEP